MRWIKAVNRLPPLKCRRAARYCDSTGDNGYNYTWIVVGELYINVDVDSVPIDSPYKDNLLYGWEWLDETESPSTPPLTEEREKVLRWVKVGERLPKEKKCFCVRWLDDDENPAILGACIFNMWDNGEFDVSDDDDLDPKNPRGTQPDEWLEETEHPSPSPQTERDIWLNIDMPEYLKDGRDKGRFSWEQGYKAAAARYRNPPSSPTQTEERGEVPDEPFDFDGWVNEKFDERGRYKQTLDEWAHYKCGVVDLYNDIEPVNKSLRKEISALQSQLSEARAEAGDYRTLLEELVPPTNPVLMKYLKH